VTPIFHVMTPEAWADFEAAGTSDDSTRGRTLAEEGFIHCSYADQVQGTIDGFYADLPEVVVVTLEPERLGAPVKVEGGFPHVYGELTAEAVVEVSRRPARS
jgi:uncharacterized protein (DUF952 family)